MSIMALEEELFFLITAAAAELHDFEWLRKHLPEGSELSLKNMTEAFACQILTGPNSRKILADICDGDLSPSRRQETAGTVMCGTSSRRAMSALMSPAACSSNGR